MAVCMDLVENITRKYEVRRTKRKQGKLSRGSGRESFITKMESSQCTDKLL